MDTAPEKTREVRQRFGTYREAMALPRPAAKSQPIDYPHATQAGLVCRVHSDGTRVFWHRWKLQVPDGMGALKEDTGREEIGELGKANETGKVTVEDAVQRVIQKRQELREAKKEGATTNRLTVKAAWALYPSEKRLHAEATRTKDTNAYERYYRWFENKYLDELNYGFWNDMLHKLEKGTLVPSLTGDTSLGTMGPLKTATLYGVINVGVNLYVIAHRHNGLKGIPRGENPARQAKANLGVPNVRKGRIPLKKLPEAWRAADQLISPWWRDMLYVFVLTGLRRNLVAEMLFSDIDWREGLYIIPMLRAGTKRRKAKVGENPEPLRLPLSKRVLSILEERRHFAPDPNGHVWYSPRPTRGNAVKKRHDEKRPALLTDSRAAWALIAEQIGLRFTPQDLRRSFANLGASSKADVFAVSLLMLHSGQTLAQSSNIPGITVQYFNDPEGQDKMREAAEAVVALLDKLMAMSDAELAKVKEPRLPQELETLLRQEEVAGGEDEAGTEDSADYE